VDGPYAAPCQAALLAEHAVLVAAGSGVTPIAGILSSLLDRAGGCDASAAAAAIRPLRRVDLIWVAGDTQSFSWFVPLLRRFDAPANAGLRSLVTLHIYLTALPPDSKPAAALLHFALDAFFADVHEDLVIGLASARTLPGRPPWPALLAQCRDAAPAGAATEVWFCGPSAACSDLSDACYDDGLPLYAEVYG
jgi:hypothetical protein